MESNPMTDKKLMPEPSIPSSLEAEIAEFVDKLAALDVITMSMLRVHLNTENLLERAIIAFLPSGSELIDNATLTYRQKLELFNSFKVADPKIIGSLRQLNKARNAAAHTLDNAIGRAQIESIGRPLGSIYVKYKKKHSKNLEQFAIAVFAIVFATLATQVHLIEDEDSSGGA